MPIRYTVSQGECLASIAYTRGLDWSTIYNHPLNESLRKARPNPNILYPGDKIVIPDREKKELDRPTEARHQFVTKARSVRLRIRLEDRDGKTFSNAKYVLDVDGDESKGFTNGAGMVEVYVPADSTHAELHAWIQQFPDEPEEEFYWYLELGFLDPIEETTGVQARLNNLGYFCGPVDGIVGRMTRAALSEFQSTSKITVTGEIDSATKSKLQSLHDGEE